MSERDKLKRFPLHRTDADAERFVDTADLSEYDFSEFEPMPFAFETKSAQISMRVPEPLLEAVKGKAKARGVPFARYIEMLLEEDVARR